MNAIYICTFILEAFSNYYEVSCDVLELKVTHEYLGYLRSLSFKSIHVDMCGNFKICFHFLLFPFLFPPPPEIKQARVKTFDD